MKKRYLACALSLPLLAAGLASNATAADTSKIYVRGYDSYLYTIDPANVSNATRIGLMGGEIHGMAFQPETGTLYGADICRTYSIDAYTGLTTPIAYWCTWPYYYPTDLDFSSDGTLYGTSTDNVYTQDINTAIQTNLGYDYGRSAIVFGPGDVLYRSKYNQLNTVNPATGGMTAGPVLTYSGFAEGFPIGDDPYFKSLAYDDLNNIVYGALNQGFNGQEFHYLVTLDVASGLVTNLGTPQYNGTNIFMDSMAIDVIEDSDDDTLPDRWEKLYFGESYPETYLTIMDQTSDYDQDSLKDIDEYTRRTDPTSPDTDEDGLTDGAEVNTHQTDPNNPDTDDDGLNDGAEVNTHHTDPNDTDTDDDGAGDGKEIAGGKNPLDPTDGPPPQVNSGDDRYYPDQPDVAVDSQGNVHVVWNADTVDWNDVFNNGNWDAAWNDSCFGGDGGEGGREIYYKMFGPDGEMLINDTMISEDNCMMSMRPTLAIDSSDKVFVTWQEALLECFDCWDWPTNTQIFVTGLNPALDNRDGDDAAPEAIRVLSNQQVSSGEEWPNNSPRMAIDPSDELHLVWEHAGGGPGTIKYAKLANDGVELISETDLRSGEHRRSVPDLAIDSNGRVHVAWNEQYGWDDVNEYGFERCYNEIHYALLDGSDDFTFLVPPTMMTEDDCNKSNRQSINVDGSGKAYIVWQDNGDSSEKNISFMKIDPSLFDDEAGTDEIAETENRENMKVDLDPPFGETFESVIYDPNADGGEGASIKVPFSRIGPDGNIQVTWYENSFEGGEGLMTMAVDQAGTPVEGSQMTLSIDTYTWTDWTNAHIAFGCENPYIVWTEYSEDENGSKILMFHQPDPDIDEDGIPDCFDDSIDITGNPDADGDGDVDSEDLSKIIYNLSQSAEECPRCDQNNDGIIDILDVRQMINEYPQLARDRKQQRQARSRNRRSRR